LNPHDLAATGP